MLSPVSSHLSKGEITRTQRTPLVMFLSTELSSPTITSNHLLLAEPFTHLSNSPDNPCVPGLCINSRWLTYTKALLKSRLQTLTTSHPTDQSSYRKNEAGLRCRTHLSENCCALYNTPYSSKCLHICCLISFFKHSHSTHVRPPFNGYQLSTAAHLCKRLPPLLIFSPPVSSAVLLLL